MGRTLLLALACGLCLSGQFDELASTDDGRQLYFVTTLGMRDSPAQRAESRIYRVAENRIELFAELGALAPVHSIGVGGARNPQVSGDGRTVGLVLGGLCDLLDNSNSNPCDRAELRGRNAMILGAGSRYFLSRNGRWVLLLSPPTMPNEPWPDASLINVETGERTAVPPPPLFGTRWPIASDGSVLALRQGTPGIWRQGEFTPLAIEGVIHGISDNARVVVYNGLIAGAPGSLRNRLVARDLVTGRETVFSSTPAPAPELILPMSISNDGRRLLYRVIRTTLDGPAFLGDTVTGQTTRLAERETVTAGTLSGNGNVALLVTSDGSIASIDLGSGSSTTLVPATPFVRSEFNFVPGSLVRLEGALPRSVEKLAGGILLDGRPLPVLFANEREIGVQIPWEVRAPSEAVFLVNLPSESPFRQNELVSVWPMLPRFEPLGPGESTSLGFKAIRSDFNGLLTNDPEPGEIFHVYATGLGAVQGQVATGAPTPLEPLFPIQAEFHCRFFPYSEDAETLFAGLAPGLTGIYQVTFRMPQGPNPGAINGGHCYYYGADGVLGGFRWARVGIPLPDPTIPP